MSNGNNNNNNNNQYQQCVFSCIIKYMHVHPLYYLAIIFYQKITVLCLHLGPFTQKALGTPAVVITWMCCFQLLLFSIFVKVFRASLYLCTILRFFLWSRFQLIQVKKKKVTKKPKSDNSINKIQQWSPLLVAHLNMENTLSHFSTFNPI